MVTCTLGEEGEVIGDRYAQLAVDHADQLGGYRISELTKALSALGIGEPQFLGGPGRWRDSGMEGTSARKQQRFIDADFDEAVGELVQIIDNLRPHVVVTYDPDGGVRPPRSQTGPPRHHRGGRGRSDGWRAVPKFYWTVMASTAMRAGLKACGTYPEEWIRIDVGDVPFGYSDEQIDAVGRRHRAASGQGRRDARARHPGHSSLPTAPHSPCPTTWPCH